MGASNQDLHKVSMSGSDIPKEVGFIGTNSLQQLGGSAQFRACGTGRPGRHPPCPPSSCYALSSLTENGQKWDPNCADDVPVRRARARASYRNISCTIETAFWLDWEQKGSKTQEKASKTALNHKHCPQRVF